MYANKMLNLNHLSQEIENGEAIKDFEEMKTIKGEEFLFLNRAGTKIIEEEIRFTFLYSERMANRVIHGQFVNPKGGNGHNYACDL